MYVFGLLYSCVQSSLLKSHLYILIIPKFRLGDLN